jgi:hypothetical protein
MMTSSILIVLLYDNARAHRAARTRALPEHFNWELFGHPFYSPDFVSCDCTTCLPAWRTGCDHRPSTIMSRWKLWKRGWAHRRQTSLTHAYKNLFPETGAAIPAMTTLRRNLSMQVFFIYNHVFFFVACFVHSSPEVIFRIALVNL